MEVKHVNISKRTDNYGNALTDTFYRTCLFCDKIVKINALNFKSCIKLSGKKKFFCPFCLRHNFHFRSSRNVLIMSYRSLIAHYYYKHYLGKAGKKKLWLNQIESYVAKHQFVGLRNPVFCYDADTYLWFVDFNRIGKDAGKAPIEEVLVTAKLILLCFHLTEHYGEWLFNSTWEKFEKAITLFYEQRQRPIDRRMLIPTLMNSGVQGDQNYFCETRDFLPNMFVLK